MWSLGQRKRYFSIVFIRVAGAGVFGWSRSRDFHPAPFPTLQYFKYFFLRDLSMTDYDNDNDDFDNDDYDNDDYDYDYDYG